MAELMDKQGILDELRRRSGGAQQEQTPMMDKQQILDHLRQRSSAQQQGTGTFAPVKQDKTAKDYVSHLKAPQESQGWFQKGAFEDGYQYGDASKAVLGTGQDIKQNAVTGLAGIPEKLLDFLAFLAPYFAAGSQWNETAISAPTAHVQAQKQQFESAKDLASDFIKKDLYDEEKVAKALTSLSPTAQVLKAWDTDAEEASVLGQKSDAVVQSLSQMAATAAVSGAVPWWVVTGATSFGGESENALKQGATMEQAGLSAAVSAGAEILTEKLFGGSGLGEKGLFNLDKLTKGISNKVVKTLLDYGIDAAAEGSEEVISSFISNLGTALYREENLADILFSEEALQEYIDSFISGAAVGGMMNIGKVGTSISNKTDYRNGLTAQEQKVFDTEYNGAIADAQKNGALTKEQKAEIYDSVLEDVISRRPAPQQAATPTQSEETAQAEKVPTQAETPTQATQAAQTPSQPMTPQQAMQETVAEIIGVPSVTKAVESFRQNGKVSNSQAEAIVANDGLLREILEMTGIAPPTTKSESRAAVKQAVAKLVQESVDNTPTGDYDRITNQGGVTNGESKVSGTDEAGLPGGSAAGRIRGTDAQSFSVSGQTPGGMEARSGLGAQSVAGRPGSRSSEVQLRVPSVLRVSSKLQEARVNRGIQSYEVYDTTTDPQSYEKALTNGRNSDAANGWCVTPKSAQELVDENVRTFMNESGTVGVGVKPDGDIVAVFKNQNGGPKRALDTAMPMAIEMGGDRLDCYGEGLVRAYENYGFVPVARVEFNPKYANEGWTPDKGTPYIYFMAHNGDSADVVTEKMRTYPHATMEDLAALPTFGKEAYDDAMAYRDNLIAQRKSQSTPAPNDSVGAARTDARPVIRNEEAEAEYQQRLAEWEARQNQTGGFSSVGAANAGFSKPSPIDPLIERYGSLPSGENPVRSDELPTSVTGQDRVSQTAVTAKGAQATPDDFVDMLDEDVAKGGMSYIPIKNSNTTREAVDYITKEGWTQALANWTAAVNSGKTGSDLVAQGALLLNNAASAGNKQQWLDILHQYQKLGTNTAQGLQAFRILKKLEPSDKLYMIRRSVEQMVQDMKLKTDIVLDEALMEKYRNAETEKARDAALKEIQKSVAAQIPSTFMDKLTALRYLNMLGNLKTQVRNFVGNLTMKGTYSAKNELAALMELIASGVSKGKVKRTKSFTVNKAQMEAAKADFDSMRSVVMGDSRYNDSNADSQEFARGVMDERKIFKNKALEGYREATNWLMNNEYFGDAAFSKSAYARALAGYLKAQGITQTDYSKISTEVMDKARLYAVKEAQQQTFRDTNWLSGWISKVGRRKDTPKVAKAVAEGVLPFRKTPANVLIRAEEYSPLGIINAVTNSINAARRGSDVNVNDAIDSWAKSLTGTGLFALGIMLSNLGILTAGEDDDKNREDFEDLSGYQNYAIVLPDGTNFTIDFLSPSAIPILMGAELIRQMDDGGITLRELESSLTSIVDPMIQMSMLQGIEQTISDVSYAENNFGQLLINSATNYLTQFLTSSLLGQLERGTEDVRMTTFVDKESALPDWLQRTLGKVSAKTPFWDFQQIPYINAWGEEEENLPTGLNLAYNLLSPGYVESGRKDALTEELNRLGTSTGENVYPDRAPTDITIKGKKVYFSKEEYVAFAKDMGQTQKKLLEEVMAVPGFEDLPDAQKVNVVKQVYSYATAAAKHRANPDYDPSLARWIKTAEQRGNLAEAIINNVADNAKKKALEEQKEAAKESYWATKNGQ